MKATGEVMSIGRTFEESLLKAIRSLENKVDHIELEKCKEMDDSELLSFINDNTDERIYAVAEAFRRGITVEKIYKITKIDRFFLDKIMHIVEMEKELKNSKLDAETLRYAKEWGFADSYLGRIWNKKRI